MSLERIQRHIVEQAKDRAREQVAGALRAAEGQLAEARRREEELLAEQLKGLDAELERRRQQETAKVRAEHRAELLRIKTGIIEKVFAEAREKILKSELYRKWLREKLAALEVKSGRIVCRGEDREMIRQLLGELKLSGLTFAEDGNPTEAGFVMRTEKYDLDVTLGAELADLREKLTGELVDRLSERDADSGSS